MPHPACQQTPADASASHKPGEAFDLDANPQHNILDDAWFELLLRICWSGSVSLLTLAPPCKEYSRLKLGPGGPKALRTPSCMLGVPNLSPAELSRVRDSREIHRRGQELFKAVASQSGVAIFEQPPSSMAWLEPENFQCLQNFHGHLAWVGCVPTWYAALQIMVLRQQ